MTRKMKDSGIEWIGEIPEEWEIVKLKSITKSHYSGGTPTASKEEFYSEDNIKGFPFVNISDITDQKYITSTAKNITIKGIENKNLKLVPKGSLLYAMYASVGKLSVSQIDLYISQAILAFDATEKADKRYLVYYLNSLESFVDYFSSGTTQMNLNAEIVKNFKVVIPSLKIQQKAIADFLDKKTQEIDNIIYKTKKAIEEYKKYKQSLITETVTKGLDKNVGMKDSGIEWIGEIPEHWDVIRLGFLGRLQNGINKAGEEFGFGYPFINYGDIYRNYQLDKSEFSGLVNSTEKERENYSVKKGDVLFTRTSEIKEEIGYAATCLESIEGAVFTGFAIRFRPFKKSRLYPGFSKYYFRSEIHRKYFVKEMNIVTRVSLGQELLMKLSVLLPPLQEQKAIASYLDQKCSQIDQIILTKENLLTEMEAYKKSLIYETVTGKREVE